MIRQGLVSGASHKVHHYTPIWAGKHAENGGLYHGHFPAISMVVPWVVTLDEGEYKTRMSHPPMGALRCVYDPIREAAMNIMSVCVPFRRPTKTFTDLASVNRVVHALDSKWIRTNKYSLVFGDVTVGDLSTAIWLVPSNDSARGVDPIAKISVSEVLISVRSGTYVTLVEQRYNAYRMT